MNIYDGVRGNKISIYELAHIVQMFAHSDRCTGCPCSSDKCLGSSSSDCIESLCKFIAETKYEDFQKEYHISNDMVYKIDIDSIIFDEDNTLYMLDLQLSSFESWFRDFLNKDWQMQSFVYKQANEETILAMTNYIHDTLMNELITNNKDSSLMKVIKLAKTYFPILMKENRSNDVICQVIVSEDGEIQLPYIMKIKLWVDRIKEKLTKEKQQEYEDRIEQYCKVKKE